MGVQRRFAVPSVAGAGLVLAWPLGSTAGLLLALAVCLTLAIAPDARAGGPRDGLALLPVGAAVSLGLAGMAIVSGSWLGLSMWSLGPGVDLLSVALVAVLISAAVVGVRRGGRVGLWSAMSVLAWVVPAAVAALSLLPFRGPWMEWTRPVWEMTDWLNHGEMVVDLLRAGSLTYDAAALAGGSDTTVYPRVLHGLLAWSTSTDPIEAVPADAWIPVLAHVMLASVAATALLLALVGLMAGVVAQRLGSPGWAVGAAAMAAPLVLLHPYWFQSLARSGHLTSVSAGVVVLASAWVAGVRAWSPSSRLVILAVLAFTAFHLWQPMATVPLAAWCLTAALEWRGSARRGLRVGLTGAAAVVLSLPLAVATAGLVEVDQARLAGLIVTAPAWATLLLTAAAVVVLVVARRRLGHLGEGLAASVGALGLLALLAWWLQGPGAGQVPYYAAKVLWALGLLAVPIVTAGTLALLAAGPCWEPLATVAQRSRPLAWLALCAPLVLGGAVVLGGLSHGWWTSARILADRPGAGSTISLRAVGAALEAAALDDPTASAPAGLVPFGLADWSPTRPFADAHAGQLARAWGVPVPDLAALVRHDAAAVCDWLSQRPEAVRLTGPERGDRELLAAGCPSAIVRPEAWVVVGTAS